MLKTGKFKSLLRILNEENELNYINFIRMISACNFKDNELINNDGDLYLFFKKKNKTFLPLTH